MRDYRQVYIDGAWVDPQGGDTIDVISPVTERPVGQIASGTAGDVDRAVEAARRAFRSYSRTTRQGGIDLLGSVLAAYVKQHQDLADALVEELGAPATFAKDVQVGVGFRHLQTAIEVLKTYAFEHAQGGRTTVRREPIGVVGMITPWNWPINQIMTKVVPALATGNTMVHKPSEVTPFTAHIIAEILHEAGVPKGVYNLVNGVGSTVGVAISGHPGIDMVSFTGSTRASISERQWTRIQGLIRQGIAEGATLAIGGEGRPEGLETGYYVRPTIFTNVRNDMAIAREEIFGPVLCMLSYRDVEDAISIANDTIYGLSAYVQSATDARAEEVAARLETGLAFINGADEDFEAPFGGYKMSGNGREWGEIAFGDFLETKAVIHRKAA
jgi:acyl-CoA reductase-like NAD-dependent aldehyde dehydrogenase